MSPVAITSEVFRWARERVGLSDERIAKKISIKPERLRAWENGDEYPNFRQAQKLASVLHIPLGYLFLTRPPEIKIPIADFRTLPGKQYSSLSPNLQDVLDDSLRKRDWYRDWRVGEGFDPLDFIGKFSVQSNPAVIIANMRQVLDIPPDFASHMKSWEDHLRQFVQKVESSGILVLQSGIVGNNTTRKLSIQEFRGFTLVDEFAPLIFINALDAISARIFTLAHELAHLWTGTSGISNPEVVVHDEELHSIEKLCNQIAAEFLVSPTIFIQRWDDTQDILDNVQRLARRFRVSGQVILRRAFELRLIPAEAYYEAFQEVLKSAKASASKKGGDFYKNLYIRNSRRFTLELLSAVNSGHLSYQEGARLLNTQPGKIATALEKLG